MRLFGLFALLSSLAAVAQPTVRFEPLPVTFSEPVDIVADRTTDLLYIVEKAGRIRAYDSLTDQTTTWLDLRSLVDDRSEGGLLGMAFHPSPDSPYVYLNFTTPDGARLQTNIARYTLQQDGVPDVDSRTTLLIIPQPANNHNAGDLAFGPDGYLYIPTGDGGGGGDPFDNGQDPQSLLGKLLRIDVDTLQGARSYAIPPDNPFVNSSDTLPEIWALGLRNPWRISFDRQTGDLYIADVGQGAREEVNIQGGGAAGGSNYGWNCREGLIAFSGSSDRCTSEVTYTDPAFDYPHSGNGDLNGASITGGFVYRGPAANLQGYYLFGDFARRRLFFYRADLPEAERLTVRTDAPARSISTFGEGRDGTPFVADFNSGVIYRIDGDGMTQVRRIPATQPLRIYPNPAMDRVYVGVPAEFSRGELVLTDVHGRVVLRQAVTARGDRIPLALPAGQAPGVYSLQLRTAEFRAVGQLRVD